MNCNQSRYQLSQCLDGRLPSGRRTLVMEHVAQCRECETFWEELQAAQRLVLSLPREEVGESFRDQLWQRIQAGEGTPEAVFHEPVPLAAKVRYALVGAAAAAAVLVAVTLLRNDPAPQHRPEPIASADPDVVQPQMREAQLAGDGFGDALLRPELDPLFASTQRLTTDLVALEAARQLERHFTTVHSTLGRLQRLEIDPSIGVEQVLDDADDIHTLGDLLLELRDRGRLMFVEPEVGADLQVAVGLLGQTGVLRRDRDRVTTLVGRALESRRLGSISAKISLTPMTAREEREVLARLNHQRPEVFPKLFFVFPAEGDMYARGIRNGLFLMEDACGTSWVAPRTEVEARENMERWMRANGARLEIQVVPAPRAR